jgi:hypothetical protein
LVGWSVGWSVGLVGRLVGQSVGWLVGWLVGRPVGRLVGWPVGQSVVDWLVSDSVIGGNRNGTKKDLPSSYDAWLPAGKAQAVIKEDRKRRITGSCRGGGLCVLGCKFVRDIERFNKGGVKADYAVMKYGRKNDCLRSPNKVGKEARTKQRGGGGRGGMNPRGILTSLCGQRGEVVRRMV